MTHHCDYCEEEFESMHEKKEHHKTHHHLNHGFREDIGEPKGFYYGTKEKKRTGFGEIDYDFGLKL